MSLKSCPMARSCPELPCSAHGIRDRLLSQVTLSAAQGARLAGVSQRQLLYWATKGIIQASGTGARRTFDLRAIEEASLIGLHLARGCTLQQAVRALQACRVCLTSSLDGPRRQREFTPLNLDARKPRGLSVRPLEVLASSYQRSREGPAL